VAQLAVIDILCLALANRRGAQAQDAVARSTAAVGNHMFRGAEQRRVGEAAEVAERSNGDLRRLAIDGIRNARHLGGLPLPGGTTAPVVVRGGKLTDLTPTGLRRLRDLGVRTVIDLRGDDERERFPTPDLGTTGLKVVHAPMLAPANPEDPDEDDDARWAKLYREWLEQSQEAFRTIVEALVETDGAVLIHCHGGTDRTGIAAGMLLSLAGADDATIVRDYVLTPRRENQGWLIADLLTLLRERWGAADAYLQGAGLPATVIAAAKAKLRGESGGEAPAAGGS
jgi:protein tyrosine phosphatase (PTP) superfamily phosphohydrolase (DUF442 family)